MYAWHASTMLFILKADLGVFYNLWALHGVVGLALGFGGVVDLALSRGGGVGWRVFLGLFGGYLG